MAYNSGSQSLCVLLAAVVFTAVGPSAHDVPLVILVAAGAAVIWTAVDSGLVIVVLVRRGGTSALSAARHVLELDALAVPLALVGALAGLLALDAGWWAAAAVLAPMPFVPDLVLVRARRFPVRRMLARLRVPAVVAIVVGVGTLARVNDVATLVALAVMGAVAGAELRPHRGTLVAPAVATVVVAAGAVVEGRDAFLVGALIAAGAVAASYLTRHRVDWTVGGRALAVGVVGALASVAVHDAVARGSSPSARAVVAALLAGLAFQIVVITLGGRDHGLALARAGWLVPVLAVAAALAVAWTVIGNATGAGLFAVCLAAALWAVAWWGAPPWASRWLRQLGTHRGGRRSVLIVTAVVSLGAAVGALTAEGRARNVLVALALAGAQSDVAMAAVAVRQWRFAPRRRAFAVVTLALATLVLTVAYTRLGFHGGGWSVVLLACVLAAVAGTAWPVGRLADRAARAGVPADQRILGRGNASAEKR
jgi:hypothetical protein